MRCGPSWISGKRLGVSVRKDIASGDEGDIWRLRDGRVLKLTTGLGEAAALVLLDAQQSAKELHPGVVAA